MIVLSVDRQRRFQLLHIEDGMKMDKRTAVAVLTIALVRVIVVAALRPIATYYTREKRF